MAAFSNSLGQKAGMWLRQGISPRRLALTLALGFAIGCIPVVGLPTLVCAILALLLRLNLPAIQAANYAAMPLQILLIVPFARLGGWLFAAGNHPVPALALLPFEPLALLFNFGSFAAHALLAWLLLAGPAVALMTLAFTLILRRLPAVASEESAV
jgi:uncharacterized protein (DUF2062 family)